MTFLARALVVLLLAAANTAHAEQLRVDVPVISTVEVSAYYPDRAQRMEVSGWARIRCTIKADATLGDCEVVGVNPPALGFDWAALKLAPALRVALNGAELEKVVGQPIYKAFRFSVPDSKVFPEPVRPPSLAVIESARPAGADDIGMATLTCEAPTVGKGLARDCVVDAEGPMGQGFGAAAKALAQSAYQVDIETLEPRLSFTLNNGSFSEMRKDRLVARAERWVDPKHGSMAELRAMGMVQYWGDAAIYLREQSPHRELIDFSPSGVNVNCGWTDDGSLKDCKTDLGVASDLGKAALALMDDLKLVRRVTFNINWGQ